MGQTLKKFSVNWALRLVIVLSVASLAFFFVTYSFLFITKSQAHADDPCTVTNPSPEQSLDCIKQKIAQTEAALAENQKKQSTLQNEIAYQDNQIELTTLKISETEKEIEALSGQIDQLEVSLSDLSEVFAERVVTTYKISRSGNPITLLLASDNVTDFVSRFYYLRRIQQNDRDALVQMQTTQTNFETQRAKREELKNKLESQEKQLASQKAQKQQLLAITKNDEKKYQQLLASAKAELEAIQAIIAGKGSETKVGSVSAGQKIASIIQGASCNSGGPHVHFIVSNNGATQNPFDYLRSGVDYKNCSGPGACSEGDPFNPSGSWDWPISPTIQFNQGYGATWAVQNSWVGKIYSFHNGIDINSDNPDVHAVKSGTLYRGSYSGSGGCSLRYVRVHHDEGGLDTFYLHINY